MNVAKGELSKRFAVKDIISDQRNSLPRPPPSWVTKIARSSLQFESNSGVVDWGDELNAKLKATFQKQAFYSLPVNDFFF